MDRSVEAVARAAPSADVDTDEIAGGRTPCTDFVNQCGASPPAFKDIYLSLDYGFLPPAEPAPRRPETHRAWDDAVGRVPRLFYTQGTRGFLDALPLLSSDP